MRKSPWESPAGVVVRIALGLLLLLILLGGCGGENTDGDSAAPSYGPQDAGGGVGPSWGLPFRSGLRATWGAGGLHGHNYRSVPGFKLSGQDFDTASIDLLTVPQGIRQDVYPLAHGRVISVWAQCHLVLVDHGYNIWTIYLHIDPQVSASQIVEPTTSLGRTIMRGEVTGGAPCGETSTGEHVHFAFLQYDSGPSDGWKGFAHYVGMPGHFLCGHQVTSDGRLDGLAGLGDTFTIPNCGNAYVPPSPTPTNTPYYQPPQPVPTPTSPPPPQTCSTPSLQAPGIASYAQDADISLVWSTDCPQSYAELWGGPYGTLNFGGWQSGTSVHIGQMYSGTYSWHVKGRTNDGTETGWSTTWSFAIASNPPPNPTPTNTPPAAPTPTPTPCWKDGGAGVTFYSGANYTGQSFTIWHPASERSTITNLPAGIAGNLGSFYDTNNAWHVVTYLGTDGTGNLGHNDASVPNVDPYWRATQSVKVYLNGC